MIEPGYYAIIPANVRYDKRLSANAKLLYGEITALSNKTGYCYATNRYFAELYNVTGTSISLWVKQLIEAGYVNSHIQHKEGTKEILNRYLSLVVIPLKDILNTPTKENLKDNNTSTKNTSNNKKEGFGETPTLFPGEEVPKVDKSRKTLFINSDAFKEENIQKTFAEEISMGVDVDWYVTSVKNWNAKKELKRTARGWNATIQDFMREDNVNNKLKFVDGRQQSTATVQNSASDLEYLKM